MDTASIRDILRTFAILSAVAFVWITPPVAAQDPPAPDPATAAEQIEVLKTHLAELDTRNADLQARLDAALAGGDEQAEQLLALQRETTAQRKLIADQLAKLDEQQEQLDAQDKRIADLETMLLSLNNRLLEFQDQLPDSTLTAALQERLDRLESSVDELPELPTEVVGAGDFPGSFQIPGTDAQLKIGGRVKTSLVLNLSALSVDDRFLTAGIPIEGTEAAGKGSRLTISARSSRFNLDLRTPTGVGHVRAFIEGDFAGDNNSMRLRHAYGQYGYFLFGQTWSALVDLKSIPEELDFEGLNANIQLRKAQVRGTYPVGKKRYTVSIENPSPDITGADGISLVPDIVLNTDWALPGLHLSTGAIFRLIQCESPTVANTSYSHAGWGLKLSGNLKVRGEDNRDDLRFQVAYGQGLGSYITDLAAEGGQDAVFDSTAAQLHTLPVFAGYVSYAHWWKGDRWRSTVCFGYVGVNNESVQPDDAYYMTFRTSVNLIYTPAPRMDVGVEFLSGRRENKDRSYGTAQQIQVAGIFRF